MKDLTFKIRRTMRKESRRWRSAQISTYVGQSSKWKALRQMLNTFSGKKRAVQPSPADFATAMREIFSGTYQRPPANPATTEPSFDEDELDIAIDRMKKNKAADSKGLVAELLHQSPPLFRSTVLRLCNQLFAHGI
eukprot:412619-Pyramimonas_sp.AAC.1